MAFMVCPVTAFVLNATPPPRPFTQGHTSAISLQRQQLRLTATGGSASHGQEGGGDYNATVR